METGACPEISALSSFLDEEHEEQQNENVKLHIQHCLTCADRIKRFRATDRLIRTHLAEPMTFSDRPPMGSCVSPEIMTAYLHDLLSVDEKRRVEEHLDGCDACLSELSSLARTEAQISQSKTVPLPDTLKRRVESLWKSDARSEEQIIHAAIRLVKDGIELIRESLFPQAISFQEVFAPVGAYRAAEFKEPAPTGLLLKTTLPGVHVSLFIQRQEENRARLEVKIEDDKLRPVVAQRVSVRREQALLFSDRTASDGKVVITSLEPGVYRLGINILGKEHNVDLEITTA